MKFPILAKLGNKTRRCVFDVTLENCSGKKLRQVNRFRTQLADLFSLKMKSDCELFIKKSDGNEVEIVSDIQLRDALIIAQSLSMYFVTGKGKNKAIRKLLVEPDDEDFDEIAPSCANSNSESDEPQKVEKKRKGERSKSQEPQKKDDTSNKGKGKNQKNSKKPPSKDSRNSKKHKQQADSNMESIETASDSENNKVRCETNEQNKMSNHSNKKQSKKAEKKQINQTKKAEKQKQNEITNSKSNSKPSKAQKPKDAVKPVRTGESKDKHSKVRIHKKYENKSDNVQVEVHVKVNQQFVVPDRTMEYDGKMKVTNCTVRDDRKKIERGSEEEAELASDIEEEAESTTTTTTTAQVSDTEEFDLFDCS